MKKNIGNKYYIIILSVIVILFNLLLFLLVKAENRKIAFWTCYGFTMFSFVLNLLAYFIPSKNSERLNPLTTFSFVNSIVTFVFSFVIFFIPKTPFLVAFIPLVIILVVFIILGVFGAMNLEQIKANPQKRQEIFTMSYLVEYLQDLKNIATDVAVRNKINDLAHFIMGASATDEENEEALVIEKQIFEYATFIKKNVENDEINNVFNNIEKVRKLVKERETKFM